MNLVWRRVKDEDHVSSFDNEKKVMTVTVQVAGLKGKVKTAVWVMLSPRSLEDIYEEPGKGLT